MRPTRLDLEGFASFREPTSVDFTDADLFVLSGPTGSGKCLPGDTAIFDGRSGRRMTLQQAVKQRTPSVVGFTAGRVEPVSVTDWHDLGQRATVRVRTSDAQTLVAALTHPVMTDRGMVPAGDLHPGDWVAQAAHLDISPPRIIDDDDAMLLGLLLGDGTIAEGRNPSLSNTDPDIIALFGELVRRRWPTAVIRRRARSITHAVSNPKGRERQSISRVVMETMEAHGVDLRDYLHPGNLSQTRRGERDVRLDVIEQAAADHGLDLLHLVDRLYPAQAMGAWLNSLDGRRDTTRDKRIPDGVVLQGGSAAMNLLSGLILTDGWCSVTKDGRCTQIGFSSSSEDLAHDVRTLARSCGLSTLLGVKHIGGRRYWTVSLDADATRSAGPALRLVGRKARARDAVLEVLEAKGRRVCRDRIPPSFNSTLTSSGKYGRKRLETTSLARDVFIQLGGDPQVGKSDARWVQVHSVDDGPTVACYDLTVDTPEHLYIADGWIVHNSSVIDAMTFALYGIVARYGDKRLVAPVISNGRNEARVQLQFAVGTEHYTAVRVVRRTATGASTKEARLERWRGDDPADAIVLAATADEVSTAVETILGLGYEHFTTTVVLPQGAFQRFLHAKASERQGLLVELLDLAVFGRIGQAARTRATTLEARTRALEEELDAAADRASDEAVAAAQRHVAALAVAVATIDDARPELDEVLARGKEQAGRSTRLAAQVAALKEVEAPDHLDALTEQLAQSDKDLAAARERLGEARTARRALDAAVDDLPSADAVRARRAAVSRLAALGREVADADAAVERTATIEKEATTALTAGEAAVTAARADLDLAREADLVATLTADVGVGDPCPVCRRPLTDEVEVGDEVLRHATQALRDAEETLVAARRTATTATTAATQARERQAQLRAQQQRLEDEQEAVDLPRGDEALAAVAERVAAVTARRTTARAAEAEAEQAVAASEQTRVAADRGLVAARTALDAARDRVAVLEPPRLERDDLAGAWATLLDWVARERPAAAERLAEADQATSEARRLYGERLASLRAGLDGLDVETAGINEAGPLRDAHVQAHAQARSRHERLVELRDEQRSRQERLAGLRRDAAVARALGQHLNRNNFEKWLLARAVNRLVAGASIHLRDLTGGAYTLRLEPDGSFGIVDHANGGEVRSARTLSGGETFLASLSLALALSDHVADFAADGAARLESLFIDEGFGTLDAATVDVVRTALEELGSTGRMVGVVTHVQALAEQLPVQFHVRKESQSSVVDRVDA